MAGRLVWLALVLCTVFVSRVGAQESPAEPRVASAAPRFRVASPLATAEPLRLRQPATARFAITGRSAAVAVAARRRADDPLKNGMIIGGVIGAGYGSVVAYILGSAADDELTAGGMVTMVVTTTAFGAGVGALIDWLR